MVGRRGIVAILFFWRLLSNTLLFCYIDYLEWEGRAAQRKGVEVVGGDGRKGRWVFFFFFLFFFFYSRGGECGWRGCGGGGGGWRGFFCWGVEGGDGMG